jgi:Thiolase, N-terminal domain
MSLKTRLHSTECNFAEGQQQNGLFDHEIVPATLPSRKGPLTMDEDERACPDTSLKALAKLRPVFKPDGTVPAGDASGRSFALWNSSRTPEPFGCEVLADGNCGGARRTRSEPGRPITRTSGRIAGAFQIMFSGWMQAWFCRENLYCRECGVLSLVRWTDTPPLWKSSFLRAARL